MYRKEVKCAIITLFHKSNNYGGTLQAYALSRFLSQNSILAEQILYDTSLQSENLLIRLVSKLKNGPIVFFKALKAKFKSKNNEEGNKYYDYFAKKILLFEEFRNEKVIHSQETYNPRSIKKCVNKYDAFITGSDQVWNFEWYDSVYFLDFVPSNKLKISYAASIGTDELNRKQKKLLKNSLKDYNAISVREENMVEILKEISPVDVKYVVDPVLLLDSRDWDMVSSDRMCNEPYILCYFLGSNEKARDIAKSYAKSGGFYLLSIPMLDDEKSKSFGDVVVNDASPEDFISLIKNAQYIFTDSFHACVFSIIYKKNFFVFNRSDREEMSSRIKSLINIFDLSERFLNEKHKENFKYIESLVDIDYNRKFKKYEVLRKESQDFLLNILKN